MEILKALLIKNKKIDYKIYSNLNTNAWLTSNLVTIQYYAFKLVYILLHYVCLLKIKWKVENNINIIWNLTLLF